MHILVSPRKKISSARRSDNIHASMPPHSSLETLWPILFMENIQSGIIFKILCTRPLQSQFITICVKKPVLQAFFLKKIIVFSHFDIVGKLWIQLFNRVTESQNFLILLTLLEWFNYKILHRVIYWFALMEFRWTTFTLYRGDQQVIRQWRGRIF